MPIARIQYLVDRYFTDSCTTAEKEELASWIARSAEDADLKALLEQAWQQHTPLVHMPDDMSERIVEALFRPEQAEPIHQVPFLRRYGWVAAAIFILVAAAGWLLFHRSSVTTVPIARVFARDIPAPATNRATLTLANGKMVDIDSAASGALAEQGGARIVKGANGQLAYQPAGPLTHDAILYNTLSNPRGSQVVTITLSDGTRVWLNAESSIRYPAMFTGRDRMVEISGEGYFEVTKKADQPFIVDVKNGVKIEVLGTSFNVNAYPGEASIIATLLEGSIRTAVATSPGVGVNTDRGKLSVVLKPGQQAQIVGLMTNTAIGKVSPGVRQMTVQNNVDIRAVMAWKNGLFAFHDADLPTVMRQLARWYDVEVVYQGNIQPRHFGGKIERDLNLSEVLSILRQTNVHFSIEDRKLIVKP